MFSTDNCFEISVSVLLNLPLLFSTMLIIIIIKIILAQEGQLDCVIWLAKHSGLAGSEPANDGMTALHAATQEGHLDCVRYLVQLAHCSPVLTDYSGCTPLHFGRLNYCIMVDSILNTSAVRRMLYQTTFEQNLCRLL